MEIDFWPPATLAKLSVPASLQKHLSVLLSNMTLMAALPILRRLPHVCLARTLLGIPCPGCGVTHSILAVQHLHLAAAWASNPAGLGVAGVMAYQILARPVALFRPALGPGVSWLSHWLSRAVTVWLAGIWIWRLI